MAAIPSQVRTLQACIRQWDAELVTRLKSAQACTAGAVLASRHAQDLCDAADRVAAGGHRGAAVALLVTALEEAVKAWALMAAASSATGDRIDPQVEQPLDALLRGPHAHRRRHAVASMADWLPSSADAFGNFAAALGLLALVVGLLTPRDQRAALLASLMATLLEVPVESTQGWFRKAWDLRQAGLYVDWDGATWRSPREVTSDDLDEARRTIRPIVASVARVARRSCAGRRQPPST